MATEDEKTKAWREGFEAGAKSVQRENDKAIKIGNAILDVMYETFATHEEDY